MRGCWDSQGYYSYNFDIMKRFILFLFIAFAVSGCKWLEEIITEYGVFIKNTSDKTIGVWGTYKQSNALLPQNKPFIKDVARTSSQFTHDFIMSERRDWLKDLSDRDTIRIFIFDREIVRNTDWSIIRDQYLVQQRYDITAAELMAIGWNFAYPPTPEMKDVKMWPPYEEAIKQHESQAE